ncbi:MAG: hypothetical protein JO139_04815 [Alphaproteobacteria bacterium]|nr:hypothetical protein [Alphaproteobacteria bacterium]
MVAHVRRNKRKAEKVSSLDRRPAWEPITMPTSFNDQKRLEETKRLLSRAPVIQNACDLDLIVFLHRHPRTLLTSEQLAGFVGYNLKEIAKAVDAFIEAGLLARTTQQALHAARMFVLLLGGPQGEGVKAVLELGSTRAGRQGILEALNAQGPRPNQPGTGPELRLVNSA